MRERGALSCALLALKNQFIDFRFDYPLETGCFQSLGFGFCRSMFIRANP